jgi:hypothetical protein
MGLLLNPLSFLQALGAMREALKYASKSRAPDRDARVADHTARIGLVELFVQVGLLTSPGYQFSFEENLLYRARILETVSMSVLFVKTAAFIRIFR